MIARVWGVADTYSLSFVSVDGTNDWQVEMPPSGGDGRYILEVFAEDSAGNQTYLGTVIYCVDTDKLYSSLFFIKYRAFISEKPFISTVCSPDYEAFVQQSGHWSVLTEKQYKGEVISCELC